MVKTLGQKTVLAIILLTFAAMPALAGQKNKTKKQDGQLVIAIKKAKARAMTDQERQRQRAEREAAEKREEWTHREFNAIEIRTTGSSSLEAVDLGDADFSIEELGEDHSGLDTFKREIVDEPIPIDFDQELRDVSSVVD